MDIRKKIDELLAEKRVAETQLLAFTGRRLKEIDTLKEVSDLQEIFQNSVNIMYQNISSRLGDIITEGLQLVFPDARYKFSIDFVNRRNSVEADIYLEDSNGNKFHPLDGVGGGVADFVSLLLRITYIILSPSANILVADEPMKFIDRDRIPEAARFLSTLCKDFNFQLICITHIPSIAEVSEKVYEVTKTKGISKITEKSKGVLKWSRKLKGQVKRRRRRKLK